MNMPRSSAGRQHVRNSVTVKQSAIRRASEIRNLARRVLFTHRFPVLGQTGRGDGATLRLNRLAFSPDAREHFKAIEISTTAKITDKDREAYKEVVTQYRDAVVQVYQQAQDTLAPVVEEITIRRTLKRLGERYGVRALAARKILDVGRDMLAAAIDHEVDVQTGAVETKPGAPEVNLTELLDGNVGDVTARIAAKVGELGPELRAEFLDAVDTAERVSRNGKPRKGVLDAVAKLR